MTLRKPDRRRRRHTWINVPGRTENWRGPNRALSLDEQLEVQRLMRQADGKRGALADDLAGRYGVSSRTIWRYAATVPVPAGLENLRIRLAAWAADRNVRLTYDDMQSLLLTVSRHRDVQALEEKP